MAGSDGGCPLLVQDGPGNLVWMAYDKYSQFATNAYQLAYSEAQNLGSFSLTPIPVNTQFNIDGSVYGFHRPTQPSLPDIDYRDPGTIPAPPDTQVTPVQLTAPPTEPNVSPPVFDTYAPPGPLTATPPDNLPDLPPVTVPDMPELDLPPVPTLLDLNLPDAPTITIPTFQGVRPINNLDAPNADWSFTPEQYASALLTKVTGTISGMLDGGTGLPASIAQALRDRANAQADVQQARDEDTVVEDMASRGFAEPSGQMMKRLAQVRQDGANRRNSLNRDINIQDQQVAVENLRFAVTQGVALESTLMQAHTEEMRLALAAAQYVRDTSIAIFNARVSLFNAEMQAYQIDAQVWRSEIEGELAQLEVFRAQIQAEQLRGEINLQNVQIYTQRVQAVTAQADLYRARVTGVQAQAQANESQAQAYSARVSGYAEQVRAYEAQWDAFSKQVSTNEIRARIYELTEDAYATRVRAWSEANNTRLSQQRGDIDVATLKLQAWRGQLDGVLARSTAERDRIGALVSISGQKVDLYRANVAVETAASDANLRMLLAALEQERARVDSSLKNVDLQIRQMEQNAALLLEAKKTVAQVSAQLAASSMSAVNFSAGTHSGLSQSFSCDTKYDYSGSIDTPTS